MGRRIKSDFLVASSSLYSGAARLFDFYGQYDEYNHCPSDAQADAMATLADWLVVGQDIDEAFVEFEQLEKCA
jgi:hypothetical protein